VESFYSMSFMLVIVLNAFRHHGEDHLELRRRRAT